MQSSIAVLKILENSYVKNKHSISKLKGSFSIDHKIFLDAPYCTELFIELYFVIDVIVFRQLLLLKKKVKIIISVKNLI